MKKFLAVAFSVVLVLALASCGEGTTPAESSSSAPAASSAVEPASSEQSTAAPTGESDKEWQKFIKEYEAWVDDYIELLKKVEANPTDTALLTEFTEMSDEVTQWEERSNAITSELDPSSDEALEYASELLRIAQKLTDATSSLAG